MGCRGGVVDGGKVVGASGEGHRQTYTKIIQQQQMNSHKEVMFGTTGTVQHL